MKTHRSSHPCIAAIEPLETRIAPAFAASINLASLAGFNGFELDGAAAADGTGYSVMSTGDVNGDGLDDIIVGAPFTNALNQQAGAAYVVFGKTSGQFLNLDLSSLDGSDGFRLKGIDLPGGNTGFSVSAAGDVNGDGFDDIIIGAPVISGGFAQVVFGKASFAPTVDLATIAATGGGFTVFGVMSGDRTAASVGAAGDVNGDGFDDIVIGAPNANINGSIVGASYILFGSAIPKSQIALSTLTAADGFRLTGEAANSQVGASVSGAGDVNGDGFDDVILGAPGLTNNGGGYVVFGKSSSFGVNLDLASLNGTTGFQFTGEAAGNQAGFSVSGGGDVNGDGFADILIGAPGVNATKGAGYVVFGKGSGYSSNFNLSSVNGTNGFQINGEAIVNQAGLSIRSAGDVNGDGFADVILGAPLAAPNNITTGAAYVVFGKSGGFTTNFDLTDLDGANGFRLAGETLGGSAGFSVSSAGDMNGDGYGDVLVGAPGGSSAAYVLFGGPAGTVVNATLNGSTATFLDVDGDMVTVKVSKGTLAQSNFDLLQPDGALGARVLGLKFGSAFSGADVTITAKKSSTGDGLVNVGFIEATGVDLGNVKVGGGLERIVVGDDVDTTPGIKSLTVRTLGDLGLPLHERSGTLNSGVTGPLGALNIAGDLAKNSLIVTGKNLSSQGIIGKIKIGGSVVGGEADTSGIIIATGNIGPITIGHDILAGTGTSTGTILGFNRIGAVKVGGDVHGGPSGTSGAISASNNIASVQIGGSLIGGGSSSSGLVTSGGILTKFSLGGDLVGGHVFAGQTLGKVTIKGDVVGTDESPATIAAGGPLSGTASVAIGSLTVGGRVQFAEVLAGVNSLLKPVNGHAQIGKVQVGGDWIASDLIAGVNPGGAGFGNADDTLSAGGPAGVVARIASIVIKGQVAGTDEPGDIYAFEASEVGSLKIGAVKYTLSKGTGNDDFSLGNTSDFRLREIA